MAKAQEGTLPLFTTSDKPLLMLMAAMSVEALQHTYAQWESVVYYLGFVIALEFMLRITSPFLAVFFTPSKQRT